jgi:cobalt-zinc-cadmium efflux system outer membrane protein
MSRRSCLPAAALLAACHSYEPLAFDAGAELAAFAARLPTADQLAATGRDASGVDVADGVDLREARVIAMCFHPDCRRARAEVRTNTAERDHAATLPDPELSADVAKILEDVPHQWLAGASLGFTLPWNGRLGLQRELAQARLDERELAAVFTERAAMNAATDAFVRWSVAVARAASLDELCARLRELTAITDRLAGVGALTNPAARAFTLELAARELELQAAQDAAASGELELKRRLGLHPGAAVSFVAQTALAPLLDDPGERSARLRTSAGVLPAALALAVAERELELAVRRQWPDLVIAPGWQEEDAQPRGVLGISLPLPLFAGNDAAIARATAARQVAAETLRGALEQATQQLAAAELQWVQASRRNRAITERLVPLAQQQVDDARRFAELGQLEPLLVLDALARVHDARMQQLDAALAEAVAVVALDTTWGFSSFEGTP